ncbi:hypothetical protein ACQE3E_06755 [Methylomonas sp. MED-D]|uniref:hypothetical protein n=1 Tax=Methylomonas sp. MED-D TaxID=3418768 RepID=UPI003CFDA0DE
MGYHLRPIGDRPHVLYFYPPGKSFEAGDDYDGTVVIEWPATDTARLLAASGRRGAAGLAEAVEVCKSLGARRILADRANGHAMPPPWRLVEVGRVFSEWELVIE